MGVLYLYVCTICPNTKSEKREIPDRDRSITCESCGNIMKRRITPAAVILNH